MDSSDWKTVSTHYIRATIVKSIENQKIDAWQPTLLIAASEDALAMARILRDELKARGSQPIPVLNRNLELFNDSNPYNEHTSPYQGSFQGRVLLVDKTDNTRASIAAFINQLRQGKFAEARAASPDSWVEPQLAVFVLHNKRRTKAADLPEGVVEFVGEETDDVHIAYATSTHTEEQPQAHHTHPSGVCQRVPSKGFDPNFRRPSPAPISPLSTANSDILRSVSSHYVETILEKAVEEQHVQERFGPTMLVAASDGALPPARLLRHYLRHRTGHPERPADQAPPQHDLPLLTPRLELYDEDTNPYLAHIMGVKEWGAASLAGQHVLVVDRADNTRTTLASFIAKLQAAAAGARAEAEAQGRPWAGDPLIGVFVLHNKQVDKQADLPADILEGRYFYGEITDGSTLLYPFNV